MAKTKRSTKQKKMKRGRRSATGINIGAYSVKIITLMGDDAGQIAAKKVTVVPLERTSGNGFTAVAAANEPVENLYDRQKAALKDAVKQHGKMEGQVVLSCRRDSIMVRYLTLPSGNLEELREMLFFDVERHVPFPIDDLEISFQVIERTSEHESRIMMVCVPKRELEPYVAMFEELNIEVHAIVPDVIGDCTAFARTLSPFETVALVNFGRSAITLSVTRDKQLLFSRSLSTSEEELLEGFPRARGWRDLTGRVTPAGVLNPREREHFSQWVDHLGLEMLRTVSAYMCEDDGRKIDRMIFIGGAGYFPAGPPRGLAPKLKTKLTVENALNGELPPSEKYNGTELTTSIGMALYGLDQTEGKINLLPDAFVQERKRKVKAAYRMNMAMLIFFILTLLGGTGFLAWYERYKDYSNLHSYYLTLQKETAQLEQMRRKVETVENYIDSKNSATNVIRSVLEILPENTYISSITFTKRRTLVINGQVLNDSDYQRLYQSIIELRPPMETEKYFYRVIPKEQITQLDLGNTSLPVTEFGFTCYLNWDDPKDKNKTR